MSHDSVSDSIKEDKVAATIVPQNHRRRSTDNDNRESSKLSEAIESNRLQFNEGFSPEHKRESIRGLVTATMVGIYGICVIGYSIITGIFANF